MKHRKEIGAAVGTGTATYGGTGPAAPEPRKGRVEFTLRMVNRGGFLRDATGQFTLVSPVQMEEGAELVLMCVREGA